MSASPAPSTRLIAFSSGKGGVGKTTVSASLALALAGELGVSDERLQTRLEAWQPSKWRGELRQVGRASVYCDFYNANPASMADAIDVFNGLAGATAARIYVLGCM